MNYSKVTHAEDFAAKMLRKARMAALETLRRGVGQGRQVRKGPKAVTAMETGGQNAATDLTAAVSPNRPMLRRERTTAITSEAKTFNNYMSFEQDLWNRRMKQSKHAPRTRIY